MTRWAYLLESTDARIQAAVKELKDNPGDINALRKAFAAVTRGGKRLLVGMSQHRAGTRVYITDVTDDAVHYRFANKNANIFQHPWPVSFNHIEVVRSRVSGNERMKLERTLNDHPENINNWIKAQEAAESMNGWIMVYFPGGVKKGTRITKEQRASVVSINPSAKTIRLSKGPLEFPLKEIIAAEPQIVITAWSPWWER